MLAERTDPAGVLARQTASLEVTVRWCTARDLPDLEWFGLFHHHRAIFLDAFARHERGENLMLVADLNGFPVGQAWIDLLKRRAENAGYIWAVRVLPPLQNAGIGSLLMQTAEQVLRDRGYEQAEVGVETENAGARRLYERLGYRCVGELSETYGYTTPEGAEVHHLVEQWLLRKPLTPISGDDR